MVRRLEVEVPGAESGASSRSSKRNHPHVTVVIKRITDDGYHELPAVSLEDTLVAKQLTHRPSQQDLACAATVFGVCPSLKQKDGRLQEFGVSRA